MKVGQYSAPGCGFEAGHLLCLTCDMVCLIWRLLRVGSQISVPAYDWRLGLSSATLITGSEKIQTGA